MIQSAKERYEWWENLSDQWKRAFNETVFQKGPIETKPTDKEIKRFFAKTTNLRFVGPRGNNPNMSFELTDVSGLEKMFQVEMIVLTFHRVSIVKPLSNLKHLKSLFIDHNQIININGLENLTHLKLLTIHRNEVDSLLPLSNLKNLESLQVSANRLTSFKGLSHRNTRKIKQFIGLPNPVAAPELERLKNDLGIWVRQS